MKGIYKEKCYETGGLEEMKGGRMFFSVSLWGSVPDYEDFTICYFLKYCFNENIFCLTYGMVML